MKRTHNMILTKRQADVESSDEAEGPAEVTFHSKNGNISLSSSPPEVRGRLSAEIVIRMTQGPTRYAISRIDNIKSCFDLLLIESIQMILINMTNLEGRRIYKDSWKEVDKTDIQAYVGLFILSGVYRSRNDSTTSLWDADSS